MVGRTYYHTRDGGPPHGGLPPVFRQYNPPPGPTAAATVQAQAQAPSQIPTAQVQAQPPPLFLPPSWYKAFGVNFALPTATPAPAPAPAPAPIPLPYPAFHPWAFITPPAPAPAPASPTPAPAPPSPVPATIQWPSLWNIGIPGLPFLPYQVAAQPPAAEPKKEEQKPTTAPAPAVQIPMQWPAWWGYPFPGWIGGPPAPVTTAATAEKKEETKKDKDGRKLKRIWPPVVTPAAATPALNPFIPGYRYPWNFIPASAPPLVVTAPAAPAAPAAETAGNIVTIHRIRLPPGRPALYAAEHDPTSGFEFTKHIVRSDMCVGDFVRAMAYTDRNGVISNVRQVHSIGDGRWVAGRVFKTTEVRTLDGLGVRGVATGAGTAGAGDTGVIWVCAV